MRYKIAYLYPFLVALFALSSMASGQSLSRDLTLSVGDEITVVNRSGRLDVNASREQPESKTSGKLTASASAGSVDEAEIRISTSGRRLVVEVVPHGEGRRIDIKLIIPERCRVRAETTDGSVSIAGNLSDIQVKTETGTIALDVPTDDLSYQLLWTESRPRFVADMKLENVKELSGGRFTIRGHFGEESDRKNKKTRQNVSERSNNDDPSMETGEDNARPQLPHSVRVYLTTARGIILLNVPPTEVGSDLRERPLTEAAKAIIRSGDSLLMEAIRRAAPKYYGDYTRALPPYKREPTFTTKKAVQAAVAVPEIKDARIRVTDIRNRAISGLRLGDFEVTEGGKDRQILSVEEVPSSFNLVLLLDVSGSVENYVDFIRKAARSFVNTVDRKDRVSIITFNDDIKVLSKFSTDKQLLSTSLDTFDGGGGTAFYDALAYVVADTLRPLKGERSAIVILTDGDDNRSFLAFDSLLGSIQESGALVYPLYVPSGVIASQQTGAKGDIDLLRNKYMSLTPKSQGEGQKLAKVSGGVYYPITAIGEIQKAYEDIVSQLRTGYSLKFRSEMDASGSPSKFKIRAKRENAFVSIVSVAAADEVH